MRIVGDDTVGGRVFVGSTGTRTNGMKRLGITTYKRVDGWYLYWKARQFVLTGMAEVGSPTTASLTMTESTVNVVWKEQKLWDA